MKGAYLALGTGRIVNVRKSLNTVKTEEMYALRRSSKNTHPFRNQSTHRTTQRFHHRRHHPSSHLLDVESPIGIWFPEIREERGGLKNKSDK